MTTATVQGKTVKVGDVVGFKSDIEQHGRIVEIRRNMLGYTELVLENKHGFSGHYIGGQTKTVEMASDCWID